MRTSRGLGGVPRLAALLLLALPLAATAGDGEYEPEDEHEHGPSFFGEAKDLKGLEPLAGVRIKAVIAGTKQSVVVSTDEDGRFRMRGFSKDVKVETVEFTCNKDGYQSIDVMRRRVSGAANAPVEIECLLERK